MCSYRIPECSAEERAAAALEFREVAAAFRRLALRGARAIRELERTGAHLHAGAASIAHFAELNGMSAYEAREMARLARALTTTPSLATEVEQGTIPVASAAILGAVADEPEMVHPEDRWVEWARSKSTRDFRRLFARRRDESRAGEVVAPMTAYVTRPVRENVERACALASRRAHEPLTLGQTIGVVFGEWLDDNDPLRGKPGVRRLPDTAQLPGSRYVPAEVDRQVRARSDDRCIVPLCTAEYWVQRSHRVPHREGGSREAEQLDLLCDYHHRLYEAGLLRIEGPPSEPVFSDARGNRIDERHPFAGRAGLDDGAADLATRRAMARDSLAANRPPAEGPGRGVEPDGALPPSSVREIETEDGGSRRPPGGAGGRAPPPA